MNTMKGAEMDSLPVPPTIKDFNEDFEEDFDNDDKYDDLDKDKGRNRAAETEAGGGERGAGFFRSNKEGSFRSSSFPNKVNGVVPPSSSLCSSPVGGIDVCSVDSSTFAMPIQTNPLRDSDARARVDREAPEANRPHSATKSAAAAAAPVPPPPAHSS